MVKVQWAELANLWTLGTLLTKFASIFWYKKVMILRPTHSANTKKNEKVNQAIGLSI